jgi:hypothetical protein
MGPNASNVNVVSSWLIAIVNSDCPALIRIVTVCSGIWNAVMIVR